LTLALEESWVSTGPYGGSEQERVKTIHERGNKLLSGNFWNKISRNILNFSFSSGSIASEDWVATGPNGGSEQEGKKIQEEQNEQHLSVREQILLDRAEKTIQQERVKKIHEEGNKLLLGNFCCKVLRSILNFSFSSGSRTASFHLSVELQILLEKTEKTALEDELGPSGEPQR
jgi:hypothetical protein